MRTILVSAIVSLCFTSSAGAQGLGLGWENGISIRGMAGSSVIQGVLGFSTTSFEDDSDNETSMDLSGYVAFPVRTIGESKMSAFGGLGISTFTGWDTDITLRGGLEHNVMVTDRIGVNGKLGLEFLMVGGRENVDDSGWNTFGTFGVIGVHWYFGE